MSGTSTMQLNNKQHDALIQYYTSVLLTQNHVRSTMRQSMRNIDKQYQRETDETLEQTRAKLANRAGDANRYQNIVVPVVKPQVEIATAYQASVFLTGVPIFGVVSNDEFIDEALQMETIIDEQARLGAWTRQLILSFRDGYKYNFGPMEVSWDRQISYNVETDLSKSATEGVPKQIVWTGNKLRRLDPYNTIIDTSVMPSEIYSQGEFAGYTELMGRIRLKKFIAELPDKQTRATQAFESGNVAVVSTDPESANYYVPVINSEQEILRDGGVGTNWLKWASIEEGGSSIAYKAAYHVTTLYCRILPGEFTLKVPSQYTPQIWKLIIINHSVIIFALEYNFDATPHLAG